VRKKGAYMKRLLAKFLQDAGGATAVEYALIGGLISISVIGGATLIGTKLSSYFPQISDNLP
jgi:pilus assembly protein Flp/PilA